MVRGLRRRSAAAGRGHGADVTITHTNPAVAQLVTLAGTGQTQTVTWRLGVFIAETVAAGGMELDPLAGGSRP